MFDIPRFCFNIVFTYFCSCSTVTSLPGPASGAITRDAFIDNSAKDILKKLPPAFEISRIKKSFAMNVTPTLIVLLQELERFNQLVNHILKTLSLLRKALAGEIGMDTSLDSIADALYKGKIPDEWRKLAPDTCKALSSWMEHLNHRSIQYRYWSSSGEPLVMWLSGLHVPESFLTALVQVACRKNNWPLDRSTLFTAVTDFADPDDVEERPESVRIIFRKFDRNNKIPYRLEWDF
jgi:dynein heavy chain, axonemal